LLDYLVPSYARSTLNTISIGLIIAYLLLVIFEYIRRCLLLILGQRMSIEIMLSYFKHVLNLSMPFFATRNIGEILSRFLDANKIIDALANATISIFLDVGMVLAVGFILAVQNPIFFLITLVSIPFYLVIILVFIRIYEKANQEEMKAAATLNSSMIESLKGIETIKAYNGEHQVYRRIDTEFIKLMKKSFKTATVDNLQQALKHGIQLISSVLILWSGSYYVMNGTITLGQLITYNSLLIYFTNPLQNIVNLQVKLQTAQVANKRLSEIISISPEQEDKKEKIKYSNTVFNQGISIENISFSYNMKAPILKNISCSIPPHNKVALVGLSGSGKSTLAKLLVHFYETSKGTINYGDINYLDLPHSELRNNVTYIPQESFFFSGTILDNLIFGLDEIPDFERILEVCDAVQLTEFINQQILRFDTTLEEGGKNLSGGQRQRFAIARALLKDSSILILDEATSGIDKLLEHEIVNYLLNLQNKTIIFITHQLSIAQSCQTILVLHKGELVEQGSHDELHHMDGIYQRLWEI
ncbi:peptide cleavage/export ABC transporter, partial [Enterococcus mundtii]|uniref:peptide cleavage/export ABC transporter n=1 Tax=Enterococcus mundtii TaxID=53346 RepID=UPI000D39C0F0